MRLIGGVAQESDEWFQGKKFGLRSEDVDKIVTGLTLVLVYFWGLACFLKIVALNFLHKRCAFDFEQIRSTRFNPVGLFQGLADQLLLEGGDGGLEIDPTLADIRLRR